jgi:hypothetical protein
MRSGSARIGLTNEDARETLQVIICERLPRLRQRCATRSAAPLAAIRVHDRFGIMRMRFHSTLAQDAIGELLRHVMCRKGRPRGSRAFRLPALRENFNRTIASDHRVTCANPLTNTGFPC